MPRPTLLFVVSLLTLSFGWEATASAQSRCEAPRVLLTVDRSSSMVEALPSGLTKWDAARTAIRELASSFESGIDFGLQPFPASDGCSAGLVRIDFGTAGPDALVDGLGPMPPPEGHGTPLAETLTAASRHGDLVDGMRSSHLVLITDGTQWGCGGYDPERRFDPIPVVEDLATSDVTVHVVGFGGAADALVLNRAAMAAGTARAGCDPTLEDPAASGHCYHQADDLAELRSALAAVARMVSEETCNGFDDDCDGIIDEGFDVDRDGFTTCDGDCHDRMPEVHPEATEVCNGRDDDCDGETDPGCDCIDGETRGCGSDEGACASGTQTCEAGAWPETCEGAIDPSSEGCNGEDDDCDGTVDEDADAECGPGAMCVDGTCMGHDAGAPDAGMPVAAPAPMEAGNCACRTTGAGSAPGALGAALVLAALLARRRP